MLERTQENRQSGGRPQLVVRPRAVPRGPLLAASPAGRRAGSRRPRTTACAFAAGISNADSGARRGGGYHCDKDGLFIFILTIVELPFQRAVHGLAGQRG